MNLKAVWLPIILGILVVSLVGKGGTAFADSSIALPFPNEGGIVGNNFNGKFEYYRPDKAQFAVVSSIHGFVHRRPTENSLIVSDPKSFHTAKFGGFMTIMPWVKDGYEVFPGSQLGTASNLTYSVFFNGAKIDPNSVVKYAPDLGVYVGGVGQSIFDDYCDSLVKGSYAQSDGTPGTWACSFDQVPFNKIKVCQWWYEKGSVWITDTGLSDSVKCYI